MSGTTNVQGGVFDPSANYHITGTWTFDHNPTFTGVTFSSPTINTPTISGGTISGATIGTSIDSDWKIVPATTYTSNTTPADITGLSWTLVTGAKYVFEINLPTTMTTNGGLSVAFALTTATLASINYQTYAATASDNTTAVSTNGTTATSGTLMFDSATAAYTHVNIKGAFAVTTGGTLTFQGSQHASAGGGDVTILLVNGYARVTRVA